jgi:hypothetical protein
MRNHFQPKPGRFGTMPEIQSGKQLDAGITAAATVNIPIATARRKAIVARCSIHYETAPVGGAAITGVLNKKAKIGGAVTPLTAAFVLTGLATQQVIDIPILASVTELQGIVQEGDYLFFAVTAAGTVTTQPVGMTIVVELLIQE